VTPAVNALGAIALWGMLATLALVAFAGGTLVPTSFLAMALILAGAWLGR
jgi:hypothetical protein